MNTKNQMEEGISSLHIFLVQRFVIAAAFIYSCTQVTNLLYRVWFLPLLTNVLQIGQIGYSGNTIGSLMELLFITLSNLVTGLLPPFLQQLLRTLLIDTFGLNLQAPAFISQYGEFMVNIYYSAVVVMLILQLLITLLPYLLGGWWYCSNIARKMNEIRVIEAQQKKELDRQRNLLFSDIVHDIKTPITTIVGYSQALNDGIISEESRKQEYLQAIHGKSLRISELISMLFEFVKLDSAGFSLHQENFDLAELLRETVITLFTDFEEKGLLLDFDIPEEVCPSYIDRIQMSRVITNLLTNAIRYSNSGDQVLVSMDTFQRKEKAYYRITVADSGLAITREFAEHIFEPFSRSDEARQTTSGGSGLGLSIAHKVAEMHGGELLLNLDYGNGYTKAFQILVPVPEP